MAEIGRVAGDLQLGNRRAAVRAPALMRDYCEVPPENRTGCDSAGSLGVVCIQASELVAEGCSEAAAALMIFLGNEQKNRHALPSVLLFSTELPIMLLVDHDSVGGPHG